jgi:hypothetical protein
VPLGKDRTTQKQEKKAPTPPATRDQHFDLFWLDYSWWKDNERNG